MYFKNRRSLQLSTRMVELILSVCRKLLPLKCLLGVVPLKLLLVKLYILIYVVKSLNTEHNSHLCNYNKHFWFNNVVKMGNQIGSTPSVWTIIIC